MTMRASSWFVGLFVLTTLLGCAEKTDRMTTAQRQKVMQWVSKTPTKPEHPLDIKFGDKVTLIGYDITSDKLESGKGLSVTWHWRVDKSIEPGFRLFTHMADAEDVSRINLDMNGIIRQAFQPPGWDPGTYIQDPQVIMLPPDWKSPKVTFYMGFWKGESRLSVTGPNDGQNRARVLTLDVVTQAEELISLHAARAEKPLTLDGKLDEADWQKATATPSFVNTITGATADPKVSVKTLWDDTHLYVAFEVQDQLLKSTFDKNDDHLWEQDCVEIMVDPDGDGKNYFEIQVSPANKVFDTRYDARRVPKPFGHVDWNAGVKSGVELRGKLNDDEADEGYTAEIAIPWTAFAAGEPKHEAPKAGDTWRLNFFVMDTLENGQRAVGWSPPRVGDFHMPQRFGKLVFDSVSGPVPVASAEEAPATTAPASPSETTGGEAGGKAAPKAKTSGKGEKAKSSGG